MIEATGLTKRYGRTTAVEELSFAIRPGVVTGWLGPNGAGKSTTLRLILGVDRPTSGHVLVDGAPYRDLSAPLTRIGAHLDTGSTHPRRTARDHLRWLAAAGGLPAARVDEVLDQVGLARVAGRRTGQFSLGMAQRLGIAAALLGDPPVLLFDEPMNGLDPEGIRWIRTLLKRLAQEGRTVVVSSHLMHEMEATADRVLVIGRGRLIADATVDELTSRSAGVVRVVSPDADRLLPLLDGAQIGREGDALLIGGVAHTAIGELAARHGLTLHELTPRRASLEAAFMALTHDDVEYVA